MNYFAYGSNMLLARLRHLNRAPAARALGAAALDDHELTFDKPGRDGSGKCTVSPRPGARVWGGVFAVDSEGSRGLDRVEGLGIGYRRVEGVVRDARGEPFDVFYYEALLVEDHLLPFDWYLDLVVAGARELNLPIAYLVRLESQASRPDEDSQRAARERRALPTDA